MLLAVNHLALAFKEKGYRDLAIRQFLKALDQPGFMDEDLLDLRYNLGQVLEEEGRFNEALQAYQECYAVDIRFRDVSDRIEILFERLQSDSEGAGFAEYGESADNWGREV
jgi:tetratricopeptide (TPR) repeat protein